MGAGAGRSAGWAGSARRRAGRRRSGCPTCSRTTRRRRRCCVRRECWMMSWLRRALSSWIERSLVSSTRLARSRSGASRRRSRRMPSITLPPSAAGCRRRVSLKRRTRASLEASRKSRSYCDAALVQLVEQLLEPAEVLAAAHVADDRHLVDLAALAAEEVDQRRGQLRRQVVDAEVAGVLEGVDGLRLARARKAGDDDELQGLGHQRLPSRAAPVLTLDDRPAPDCLPSAAA